MIKETKEETPAPDIKELYPREFRGVRYYAERRKIKQGSDYIEVDCIKIPWDSDLGTKGDREAKILPWDSSEGTKGDPAILLPCGLIPTLRPDRDKFLVVEVGVVGILTRSTVEDVAHTIINDLISLRENGKTVEIAWWYPRPLTHEDTYSPSEEDI